MAESVTQEAYPRLIRFLALAMVFVLALAQFTNIAEARSMDYVSFWAAGKLTLAGDALAAYDVAVHKQMELAVVQIDGLMPFAYPPPYLLIVTPFALLPYAFSALAWTVATFALYIVATQRAGVSTGWSAAAFPPVVVNGIIAQNGALTGAIFIFGSSLIQRHPVRAGLILGCLVIKPQLAVLLPLALAAGSHWRAFAGATLSTVGWVLIGLIAFGIEAYVAFFEQLPLFSSIAADGLVGWHKMSSVYAAMRLAGANAGFAWTAHIVIACAAALLVFVAWRGPAEIEGKAALLAAASVLISPYVYLYDTLLLALPLLWLARRGEDPRILAVLWCIPLVVALQNWGLNQTVNPAPLLPIALMLLVARRLRRETVSAEGLRFSPQT